MQKMQTGFDLYEALMGHDIYVEVELRYEYIEGQPADRDNPAMGPQAILHKWQITMVEVYDCVGDVISVEAIGSNQEEAKGLIEAAVDEHISDNMEKFEAQCLEHRLDTLQGLADMITDAKIDARMGN